MKKRFNEGDVVYFISSSVLLRKLLLFVMLVDFVQYGLQMAIVVLLEHVFVKANCIVQKKRQNCYKVKLMMLLVRVKGLNYLNN